MNRQTIAILILVVVSVVAGGLYYFFRQPYVLRLSENELQQKLNVKLPQSRTYLYIFQVTLDHARVNLKNGTDRVDVELDAVVTIQVGSESKLLSGLLEVSGGIKYVPDTGAFYVMDPLIERIAAQGVPVKYIDKMRLAVTEALVAYYGDHPIFVLKDKNFKQTAARLILKSVVVENRELVVTLGL